jgi:hypothetical protein
LKRRYHPFGRRATASNDRTRRTNQMYEPRGGSVSEDKRERARSTRSPI